MFRIRGRSFQVGIGRGGVLGWKDTDTALARFDPEPLEGHEINSGKLYSEIPAQAVYRAALSSVAGKPASRAAIAH
jgi:hypothetical protein